MNQANRSASLPILRVWHHVTREMFMVLAGAVIVGLLPLVTTEYQTQVLWAAFYLSVVAISWNLVAGYGGMFSLAQHALAAIGGYISGAAVLGLNAPIWVGVLAGCLCTGVIGFLLGAITLHLRSVYFAIATWVFSEVVRQLININYAITHGAMGLQVPLLMSSTLAPYYVFLGLLVAALFVKIIMMRMKIGYRIHAIRDDEELAVSNGVNAGRTKRVVFTLSAAMAGAAGAIYGHSVGLLTPSQIDFSQMSLIIVAVVLGGFRTTWGPVIGAFLVEGTAELLRFSLEGRLVLFAALLILVLRIYPSGIVGALDFVKRQMFAIRERRRATV